MKRIFIAAILILALASSFVVGMLTSPASAGGCYRYCDFEICHLFKCCAGKCLDMGPCPAHCPL